MRGNNSEVFRQRAFTTFFAIARLCLGVGFFALAFLLLGPPRRFISAAFRALVGTFLLCFCGGLLIGSFIRDIFGDTGLIARMFPERAA